MKKLFFSLFIAVFVLTGCNNNNSNNSSNGVSTDEFGMPVMEGEISVTVVSGFEILDVAAELFMQKHPGVKVNINRGLDFRDFAISGSSDDMQIIDGNSMMEATENYLTQLNIRIMNGSADDIIVTSELPFKRYTNMGVFEDLTSFLNNSPEINNESHFMNIVELLRDENGNLYHIPLDFDVDGILYFNRALVEASNAATDKSLQSINYRDAIELAIQMLESANKESSYLGFFPQDIALGLINDNIDEFINLSNGDVNIDSEQFISILEEVKELEAQGYFKDINEVTDFVNMSEYIAVNRGNNMLFTAYSALWPESDNYYSMLLSDANGNINMSTNTTVGINSASNNKVLAWEFIRFMLSDEFQSNPAFANNVWGIGLNRSSSGIETSLDIFNEMNNSNVEFESYINLINSWVSQINVFRNLQDEITDAMQNEFFNFFDGTQTAEETARILQSRIYRYLNE